MTGKPKNDPSQKPQRQPRRKAKKSLDEDALSDEGIREAVDRLLKNELTSKKKSINNIKSIESLLSQYLNSFILIGYTQDKKEFISVVNAKNEQHADSLSAALNKFILQNSTSLPPRNIPPII